MHGPKAFFANMLLSRMLTINLDVPEPWLVEPVVAVHDLNNILLENLADTRTLQAVFEHEALVLTGHCSEKDHEPPRGLQLILGTKSSPHMVDTSLPQEWLWCESWCGNATKLKAKMIDLCNNPMTKEPKLQGAKRIVAEWPDLDLEARQFTAKILGENVEPQEQAAPPLQMQDKISDFSSEDEESKAKL
ncbi:UDP-glucose:glyco glucosyltransferase isoform X2 [Olea europaea subsp. europaea]|uniref:UDP-glucose:glyco glucosyltransferase isoform X2 n=1 Tax=Olea europaea subsp. europaea TaxID=158383 RepID=A0A8S0SDS8_OLEEU|nr:UDP-glucose:glyco glucosyltransferase isoform X2 [Olea europaea subsp. europaea]